MKHNGEWVAWRDSLELRCGKRGYAAIWPSDGIWEVRVGDDVFYETTEEAAKARCLEYLRADYDYFRRLFE